MKSKDIAGYYTAHFNNIETPCVCEECGKSIYKIKSSNIAHILPKSNFKSVEFEYYNYLLLCIECHARYDSSFRTASEMKCFKKAVFRYNLFKEHITEDHKILKFFT